MRFTVLSLFPEFVESMADYSVIGRGIQSGLISLECVNIRDYTLDKHNNVDDYGYGGGPGMVIQPQPVVDAILKNRGWEGHVVHLSPRGKVLTQEKVEELSEKSTSSSSTAIMKASINGYWIITSMRKYPLETMYFPAES